MLQFDYMDHTTQPIDRLGRVPITSQNNSRKSFFIRIVFIALLIIFIIIAAGISVLRNSRFQFNQIHVFGAETFSGDVVQLFAKNYISGNRLGVIPKSSTILFSKTDFESALKKNFPIMNVVYVTFPKPDAIDIHIQEKKPIAVWCFSVTSCGFIDQDGVVYGYAPNFSEGVYPVFSSESVKVFDDFYGKQIIEPHVMNRFITLFTQLQSNDMKLTQTIFLDNGDIAFSIEKLFDNYPTDSAQLLGTLAQDDSIFIRDMTTGLGNKVFKDQFITSPKSLEYIDMRFKGKIFYKFKSQEKPTEKAEGTE